MPLQLLCALTVQSAHRGSEKSCSKETASFHDSQAFLNTVDGALFSFLT
jgi:hypothetical protein